MTQRCLICKARIRVECDDHGYLGTCVECGDKFMGGTGRMYCGALCRRVGRRKRLPEPKHMRARYQVVQPFHIIVYCAVEKARYEPGLSVTSDSIEVWHTVTVDSRGATEERIGIRVPGKDAAIYREMMGPQLPNLRLEKVIDYSFPDMDRYRFPNFVDFADTTTFPLGRYRTSLSTSLRVRHVGQDIRTMYIKETYRFDDGPACYQISTSVDYDTLEYLVNRRPWDPPELNFNEVGCNILTASVEKSRCILAGQAPDEVVWQEMRVVQRDEQVELLEGIRDQLTAEGYEMARTRIEREFDEGFGT